MTELLQGLADLDLGGLLEARERVTATISSEDLARLTSDGAVQTALAGLGTALDSVERALDDPAALAAPLAGALGDLAGSLLPDDDLLARYLAAVRDGAELVAGLLAGLDGDPAAFGRQLGLGLGDAFGLLEQAVGGYARVALDEAGRFRTLIETVERGVPVDAGELAELAVEALLPLPGRELRDVRARVSALLDGAVEIALPAGRNAGLLSALDAVAEAAVSADADALRHALAGLERIRRTVVASVEDDLGRAVELIGRLHVVEALEAVAGAGEALQQAEEGVLEALDLWREQLAHVRQQMKSASAADVAALLDRILDLVEQVAREQLEASIDAQVRRAQEWVREALAGLGLRALRAELSAFIHGAAQAVEDADLDRLARDARQALDDLRSTIEGADVAGEIQAKLEELRGLLEEAVGKIVDALQDVKNALSELTGPALAALEDAASALAGFKAMVDEIVADVNNLGIEEAGQQVVQTLHEIRETAEKLLSVAPLPEPLRPVVEQLIETVESVDLRPVLSQVEQAADELKIPPEVAAQVEETLQKAQAALENLIPDNLLESLEQEVADTLAVIAEFDPTTFTGSASEFVDSVADAIHDVDLSQATEALEGPFQELLRAIDAVHPRALLAPAIQAFDELLGQLPGAASAAPLVRGLKTLVGEAGGSLTRAAAAPATALAPAGSQLEEPPERSEFVVPPSTQEVRPGDVIRLLGYLPAKLREGLAGLEAGAAGDALRSIDALTGGLAADLRRLQAVLFEIEARLDLGIDELLGPLAEAQLRAQLAISANFSAGSFEVEAALDAVALAGPGPLRAELDGSVQLARTRARAAGAAAGVHGDILDRMAGALERCRLTALASDVDGLLAALDPEPLAAEVDELFAEAVRTGFELLKEVGQELRAAADRVRALIEGFNPGLKLQRFLAVLDVLREELELLSPRRLADELGEVHAAIRASVEAYDPARFVGQLQEGLTALEEQVRALDPAVLLGGVSFQSVVDDLEDALPTKALEGLDTSLEDVGKKLAAIDPAELLEAVNGLAPRVAQEFREALEATKEEIVALLKSLKFATGSASATVEVKL